MTSTPRAGIIRHQTSSAGFRMATDAFTHPWPNTGSYAFPPFALISRLLAQVRHRKISLTLMTPLWWGEPWFPALLELSHRDPFLLPWNPLILWDFHGSITPSHTPTKASPPSLVHHGSSKPLPNLSISTHTLLEEAWAPD